jgi:hypothetical protein
MNRSLIVVFVLVLLCGSLVALSPQRSSETAPPEPQSSSTGQPVASTPASAGTAPAGSTVAPGSVLLVKLATSINAKKAKKGDEVVAKVTQDIRNATGTVIVPKDTKVVGHVTEVQVRSKDQKESELAIAFDRAVLKNGQGMQMPMLIQAIIAPRNPADSPSSAPAPLETRDTTAAIPKGEQGPGTPNAFPPQTESAPMALPGQARGPITGNTQGVIGIADLKLSVAPAATEGSLVTSDKNNVQLDDGTFLLLRVNQ